MHRLENTVRSDAADSRNLLKVDYVVLVVEMMTEKNPTRHTLADLQATIDAFAAERHWEKFHAPKNLAMSVAIEAAELMEHFQWTESQTPVSLDDKHAIGEEMADVLAYLLRLASVLDLDLAHAFQLKMAKNAIKYPVESGSH